MYTFTFSYGGATVAQTVMSLAGAVPSLWISPVSGMLYADVPNVLFVQVRSTGPFTLQWLVNGMMQQQQTGGNALRLSVGCWLPGPTTSRRWQRTALVVELRRTCSC